MKRRTQLILGVIAGASLLAFASVSPRSSTPKPPTPALHATTPLPEASASSAVKAPAASAATTFADLGSRRLYEVDHTLTVALSASKGDGPDAGAEEQTALITRLRASLAVTLIANEGGLLRYRGLLGDVNASANGQPYPEATVQEDLARPFYFETDEDGKVVSVAFEAAAGGDARGIIKALVASSQVVAHRGGTADAWTTREEDPTGEYEARYTREPDTSRLRKVRTRYLQIATEKGLRSVDEVGQVKVQDETRIDLLAGGDVDKLASRTEIDMQFGRGMPRVRTTSTLAARLTKNDRDTSSLAAMNADWRRQRKGKMASPAAGDDAATAAATRRAADEETLKTAKLADLERDLAAAPVSASRERSVQMARLQADFRLHPEDTRAAVRYVQSASVADGQAITGALGGAATPEALEALVDIAGASQTAMDVRVNAIAALAINPTPSSASVQGLKALAGDGDPDIRSASTLALGGAANTLRDADPSGYQDAVGTLLTAYAAAQSSQEKALVLRALGNSGDPRVLALAEDAMKNGDVPVRMAAVTAVRFVPGGATDQFLMSTAQTDADPSVRVQAIATAEAYRALPGYLPTFAAILQTEDSALVRRAVVQALNVIRANPQALALVNYAAQNDPSEDVRRLAKSVVDSLAGASPN